MLKKIYAVLDKKQRIEVFLILIVIFINSIFELAGVSAVMPLFKAVTDPAVIDENVMFQWAMRILHLESGTKLIIVMALGLAAIYVIKNLYILWMNRVLYKFSYENQAKLAGKMFESYIWQDLQFHYVHNVAELNRNVELDIASFFYTVLSILQLATEILVCFVLVVFLAFVDFETTMVMAVLMTFLVMLFLFVFKKRMKWYGARSRVYSEGKSKWFLQSFNGIKEIKTVGKEEFFTEQYRSNYDNYAKIMQRQQVLNSISKPMVEMICISGILVFMAVRIMAGADMLAFVPKLTVFAMAAFRMMPSFNRISGYLNSIMFNKASVDAVYHDLGEIEKMTTRPAKKADADEEKWTLKKSITAENITFAYESKPDVTVLNGVTIEIPSKKSIALVGSSGAGKTTLADIILGLYQPQSGRVLMDGKDIHENMDAWRRMIGYIPQNIYLLDDSIRANIALGVPEDKVDDDKIWAVLEEAQLADFIREQEDGLDTNIGDRGVKLSGGQRQRIGIARALYTDPELLVLDEATSALDTETETAVMDAIFRLSGKVTMIVIAHRITTIRNCDHIYKIADGKATEVKYEDLAQ
ncbi:MAG: ABC transporter ATP-binding protein [Lachnospiraceae bacterium]|nr:ABC transporter ATP-binding protein [Lachnospiraceae bacterium]MBR6851053.1 ABC transporter ATP-binding protein [Lachnospiraceae bacterium]